MKKRVIICGYPKSGNTWLTRLTAEVLRCPVVGFWCKPFNLDLSIEGVGRESEFQCFKAHYTFKQLEHTLNIYGNETEKIIYIYRDPRSVVVSASHYFKLKPEYSHSRKLELLARAIVEGTDQGAWLNEPWKKHVEAYQNKDNVFMLSYEDLKLDPLSVLRKVSSFLSIDRNDNELEEAIQKQSFDIRKKQFQQDGKIRKARFLRAGIIDSWLEELPAKDVKIIEQRIGGFMQELGYQLSSDYK